MRDLRRYQVIVAPIRPDRTLQYLWRSLPVGPFRLRLAFDIITPPQFAYGLYHAALTAKRLGIPRISAIEFGVAGGNGLVALERISTLVERQLGVEIEIYGFDTGTGMPTPADYRDLPYLYRAAQLRMDEEKLKTRLKKATLILGDVNDTVDTFIENHAPAPIGFVSFDVVYYSSTIGALKLFDSSSDNLLPRVFCHFDDTIGEDDHLHSEWTGQLLAIREFNKKNPNRKLATIYGLRHKRIIASDWHDQLFVLHDFQHPQYDVYLRSGAADRQMPLKGPR